MTYHLTGQYRFGLSLSYDYVIVFRLYGYIGMVLPGIYDDTVNLYRVGKVFDRYFHSPHRIMLQCKLNLGIYGISGLNTRHFILTCECSRHLRQPVNLFLCYFLAFYYINKSPCGCQGTESCKAIDNYFKTGHSSIS